MQHSNRVCATEQTQIKAQEPDGRPELNPKGCISSAPTATWLLSWPKAQRNAYICRPAEGRTFTRGRRNYFTSALIVNTIYRDCDHYRSVSRIVLTGYFLAYLWRWAVPPVDCACLVGISLRSGSVDAADIHGYTLAYLTRWRSCFRY